MRVPYVLACIALLIPSLAFADQSIAGKWRANLASHVTIEMNVSPDGNWDSQTLQNGSSIARMSGTYRQTRKSGTTGTLVFTPTQAQTTAQHGATTVERDVYSLSNHGQVMRLTSGGDTMVFHKQAQ